MHGTTLQSQLNNLLHDLEVIYLDLVGGNKWAGIIATPSKSSFFNGITDKEEDINASRALAARNNIPWDKWVKKFAECHHCGEKGHIRPYCPGYLKKVASGEIKRNVVSNRPNVRSPQARSPKDLGTHPPLCTNNNFLKNPKAKAFLSAFQVLFNDESDDDNAKEDSNSQEDVLKVDNKDLHSFLSTIGSSLKE
jgi:hypothetical protein